jgi:hypothetical protein
MVTVQKHAQASFAFVRKVCIAENPSTRPIHRCARSDFEKAMREMRFTQIEVPITNIRGFLTSYPDWGQAAEIVIAPKEKYPMPEVFNINNKDTFDAGAFG